MPPTMPNIPVHLVLALAVWAGASVWSPARCQEAARGGTPFDLTATRDADGALRLRWVIAAGTYLYRDRISAATTGGQRLPIISEPGETKDDPNFGPVEIYHNRAEASVPEAALAGLLEVRIAYQGCAEMGICYPPVTRSFDLPAPAARSGANLDKAAAVTTRSRYVTVADQAGKAIDAGILSSSSVTLLDGNLPGVLVGMFGLGVLLAFTPCVLPMMPILSGMLVRSGAGLTAGRGFRLSSTYVLGMAMAYASLGLAAAWLGRNLQVALQTPAALGLMAMALVGLSLSMFGLFDIQAPQWWRDRAGSQLTSRSGSVLGSALLGFASALIIGPCVTPPLAAALLYVAQTGQVARGALVLFALGLGMGAPLVAVGTVGAHILPRPGAWLVRAKQAFGFVFLALAISLVARVLPDALSLLLWAVLAVGIGVSLAALAASGVLVSVSWTGAVIAIVYGGTLVVGAAAGGSDPLRPLSNLHQPATSKHLGSRTVTTPDDLDIALRDARAKGKPVLLEFAADWCTACKTNERVALADAEVQQRLTSVSNIRADVTRDDAGTRALMQRFEVIGPPTLIFFRADGTEVRNTRTEGEVSSEELRRRLVLVGN